MIPSTSCSLQKALYLGAGTLTAVGLAHSNPVVKTGAIGIAVILSVASYTMSSKPSDSQTSQTPYTWIPDPQPIESGHIIYQQPTVPIKEQQQKEASPAASPMPTETSNSAETAKDSQSLVTVTSSQPSIPVEDQQLTVPVMDSQPSISIKDPQRKEAPPAPSMPEETSNSAATSSVSEADAPAERHLPGSTKASDMSIEQRSSDTGRKSVKQLGKEISKGETTLPYNQLGSARGENFFSQPNKRKKVSQEPKGE